LAQAADAIGDGQCVARLHVRAASAKTGAAALSTDSRRISRSSAGDRPPPTTAAALLLWQLVMRAYE
jgi:hypothetical protein